jgi:thioredoxin 1
MDPVRVTDTNFNIEVIDSPIPVLVEFWANWCGPCRVMNPILNELAGNYEGRIKIATLEVDDNPGKTHEYKVLNIPNLKIFKNGKVIDEIVGAVPKHELTRKIDDLLPASSY